MSVIEQVCCKELKWEVREVIGAIVVLIIIFNSPDCRILKLNILS